MFFSFSSIFGYLLLDGSGILQKAQPKTHVPSVDALSCIDTYPSKSLMLARLRLDSVLLEFRDLIMTGGMETHGNWLREGFDNERANLDHKTRHEGNQLVELGDDESREASDRRARVLCVGVGALKSQPVRGVWLAREKEPD